MKRRITVSRNYLDFVAKTFAEVGYDGLGDYEKEIMDATDHDGLRIIEERMTSGNHSHYCPECKRRVPCPQITHCKRPDESLCVDCGVVGSFAEDRYLRTGKRPGEAG